MISDGDDCSSAGGEQSRYIPEVVLLVLDNELDVRYGESYT